MNNDQQGNNTPGQQHGLPVLICLIAAGLAGNYWKFPLFLNIDFLFGSIFAMLALQLCGLGRGIIAALIISSYTFVIWNHPYAIIVLTAEAAVVGWLYSRQKIGLVLAGTLYWLCFGIPLDYLFYHGAMHVSFTSVLIIIVKHALNGIVNTLIARLIFTAYVLRTHRTLLSFREQVFNMLVFFVLFPALLILGITSRHDFAETDRHIRQSLVHDSRQISDRLATWLQDRTRPIASLAKLAQSHSPTQMQPFIEQARAADSNFSRIGLHNRETTAIAYSPLLDELGESLTGKGLAERPYIPELKRTLQPKLSEVMITQFGSPKPIVTILAPVVSHGEYAGYATGILSLDRIQHILDINTGEGKLLYTLLDRNGNIITTNRPDQKSMTRFVRGKGSLNPVDNNVARWIPVVPFNIPTFERRDNTAYVTETSIGTQGEWRLILEQPTAPFQSKLRARYSKVMTLVFVILLGSMALAEVLSRKIISSMEMLRQTTAALPDKIAAKAEIAWPTSYNRETDQLINNFRVMANALAARFNDIQHMNETLENQVEERTARLRASEERYRAIIEAYDGLIYICSPDYRIEFMNQRMIERTGRDATGEPCFQVLHGIDATCPWCVNKRVFEGEIVRWEIQSPKDGRWYYVVNSPIHNADGTLSKQAMILDITDRKQAEEALRREQSLLRCIVDSVDDLIFIKDQNGVYLGCNKASEEFIGLPECEQVGKSDLDFFDREMAKLIREKDRLILEGDGPSCDEEWVSYPDGRIVLLDTRKTPFYGPDGKIEGLVGIARDITERKQMEDEIRHLNVQLEGLVAKRTAELAQTNRDLHNFCYAISHELRAPVARLKGFSQLLQEVSAADHPAEAQHCAERIVAASDLLQQVIDAVLQLSRLTKTSIVPEPIDLSDLAREVAAELVSSAPERRVELVVADGLLVSGDPRLMYLCLSNLLGNALKYTARQPLARIEFGMDAGRGALFVRDNGIGFDMAHAGKLFEPFLRLHSAQEFSGTGIGLALVQRIIELHGGRIWAEAAPDRGAAFFFTLAPVQELGGESTLEALPDLNGFRPEKPLA